MQHIQDKAFDQLFKDKLEIAEVQPSADLWNNIAAALQPVPKHRLPVYWMAAALAVVVVGLGLLLPKTEKMRLHAPVKLAGNTNLNRVSRPVMPDVTDEATAVTAYKSTPLVIAPRLKPDAEIGISVKEVQPKPVQDRPVNKPAERGELAQPLKETMLAMNEDMAGKNLKEEEKDNIAAVTTEEPANKGIRNVGDLVNFVVNKIDRREKKLIQFDTDDDNSSIVALNIGFIKLNRKADK